MIIDTHTHYNDEAFDLDRDEIIKNLYEQGIEKAVNIGTNLKTTLECIELAEKYGGIYASAGIHPSYAAEASAEVLDKIKKICENKKVLAIGEIGLDYHWEDSEKELQKEVFKKQLELAAEVSLPVVIHSRDAAQDTFDILKESKVVKIGGVMHCYSYGVELAREYLKLGMFFGIGGVATFKNARKLKEVIEYLPIEAIVLETDCPYLAPEPFRGKRNSSLYLKYVAAAIADIKGVSMEYIIKQTNENAYALYKRLK